MYSVHTKYILKRPEVCSKYVLENFKLNLKVRTFKLGRVNSKSTDSEQYKSARVQYRDRGYDSMACTEYVPVHTQYIQPGYRDDSARRIPA